jgi:hypothetical protein
VVSDQPERSATGSTPWAEPGPDATVTADAQLPALDDREVAALRAVGRQWSGRTLDSGALPVDPGLRFLDGEGTGQGRFVQIRSARQGDRDDLEATPAADEVDSGLGRVDYAVRRLLVGPPLRSTALAEERIGKLLALPVLSPDALSSVAYGPEAMLAILMLAGSSRLSLSLPIGAVLVVLMVSVGLGYRQVIRAYPHGGGSYIVASDSLGPIWGLLAGAGLILDYILTVAGIVVLAVPAAILYAAFDGQTEPLIPLFAIGVFVAFTLAQSAMVAYWWRHREPNWRRALAINLLGAVLSGAVAVIAAVTKFAAGAWIVVLLIPAIVVVCQRIHRYYQHASQALTPRPDPAPLTLGAPPSSQAVDSIPRLESHDKSSEASDLR